MFDINDYIIVSEIKGEEFKTYEIQPKEEKEPLCPVCGSKGQKNQRKTRTIRDIGEDGKPVNYRLDVQRYSCPKCHKTFDTENLPRTPYTERFADAVGLTMAEKKWLKISNAEIQEKYGVSVPTMKKLQADYESRGRQLQQFKKTRNLYLSSLALKAIIVDLDRALLLDIAEPYRLAEYIEEKFPEAENLYLGDLKMADRVSGTDRNVFLSLEVFNTFLGQLIEEGLKKENLDPKTFERMAEGPQAFSEIVSKTPEYLPFAAAKALVKDHPEKFTYENLKAVGAVKMDIDWFLSEVQRAGLPVYDLSGNPKYQAAVEGLATLMNVYTPPHRDGKMLFNAMTRYPVPYRSKKGLARGFGVPLYPEAVSPGLIR